MTARDYYAGGFRAMVEGVPVRLAHKPSAHNLAWMRSDAREREKDNWRYLSPIERREERAKEARRTMQIYADALGISLDAAKAKIGAQHEHNAANPLIDLSWKYDL